MTIDRELSGNPFGINLLRCHEAAASLSNFVPTPIVEPWTRLPRREQLIFKALFISICHQFNWDFLQGAMAGWLLPTPTARLAEIEHVTPSDISKLLAGYPKPERVHAQQRATMLRETARALSALHADGALDRQIRLARLAGDDGFYAVMRAVPAFREDELEKKVRVLAHDVFREGIIIFRDPENLRPAVEYHLIRLYLRTGRVFPKGDGVREALLSSPLGPRPRLVKLLRQGVEEAMKLTSFYSGLDVATLNYVEWQIGRTLCLPDPPAFCRAPPEEPLPGDVAIVCPGRCAFSKFCQSLNDSGYDWFHEPQFQKAIY